MPFHEFWVVRQAEDEVENVNFLNSEDANPAPGVVRSLEESDNIIIGPSNPITSLGPILEVDEIRTTLKKNRDKVWAVSPVLENAPVSGPTKVLMGGLGYEVSPASVAEIYREFVGNFILHEEDKSMNSDIVDMEMNVFATDILIPNLSSRVRLAKEILQTLN